MKDDKDNIQLSAVEDHGGILTIRGGGARRQRPADGPVVREGGIQNAEVSLTINATALPEARRCCLAPGADV